MKRPPVDFENRLSRLFDNRLRIRWSNQRDEWHLEYKVGRGREANFFVSSYDDGAVRARDGYAFLMSVREGDRMPCPKCGCTLKVPKFELGHAICDYCKLNGKGGKFTACYFPLEGDTLIQHLSRIDPLRSWRDNLHKVADANNEKLLAIKERDFGNHVEGVAKDYYNKLAGIPQTGYTGKEFKG